MPSRVSVLQRSLDSNAGLHREKSSKSWTTTKHVPSRSLPSVMGSLSRNSSVSSNSSSGGEKDGAPKGKESVHLTLNEAQDLPSVPYKLRFALSPQEWDERVETISGFRQQSGKPTWEMVWAFFCIALPAGIGYPLYLALISAVSKANDKGIVPTAPRSDNLDAGLITTSIVLIIFMLLSSPLFIRKYVLQRRMNRELRSWKAVDIRKTVEIDADVEWRVKLPGLFRSQCHIVIPVPPRTRTASLEAALKSDKLMAVLGLEHVWAGSTAGAPLSRKDSLASQRSMFEDD